ncbi:hypothetical protein [Burkholderia gladioli]|uniref:hypothetical protein n=1 Tax=Burkholderia gladioli TaxID=28095 RepID=UPI0011B23B06|nr:hypothetical protein [Burkholderia gladioli]
MPLLASSWGVLRGAQLSRGERLAGCELVDPVRWRRPRPGDQMAAGRAPGRGAVVALGLSRAASAWPAPSWSTWCAGAGRGGVTRWPPGVHLVAVPYSSWGCRSARR